MDQLSELNSASEERAIRILEPLIERAPEIARRVASHRPFTSINHLRRIIQSKLLELSDPELMELFRAHPELAPANPLAMTSASQSEQGRLNLTADRIDYRDRLDKLNAAYREKFGFPFITALVRHKDIDSVFSEFEACLTRDQNAEINRAVEQIMKVSSARVCRAFSTRCSEGSHDEHAAIKRDQDHEFE